jgi:hypothetical protein
MDKGASGERVFADAFKGWKQKKPRAYNAAGAGG